ncbi:hypothetical protein F4561_004613 [Lipingzhangella halophila]|uniref:DUF3558 domain-containing protein n=1 Tax=Lipingzhangella halophila TaxID=1783352 RepID=A0A7W7W4N9_9ACTN|nr:hypothetical protein [Lipingzhangella halophila]MBB4933793.1 hypothetical protein [Lipingzhangella halophila]
MAGYPPAPPPPGQPGPPQGPYGPQNPYGAQQPYGPPGSGPPPGPGGPVPPPPHQPPRRRNGLLVAGIAGGVAVLVVVGVTTWAVLGHAPPYSSAGECDELLTEDVLTSVAGAEEAEVERLAGPGYRAAHEEYEDWAVCLASPDPDEPWTGRDTTVRVSTSLHAPEPEDDDYSEVRRYVERNYEKGLDGIAETSAEVDTREIPTGDGGIAFSVEDTHREVLASGTGNKRGHAVFTTRNLRVSIEYSGTSDVSAEEHLETVVDLANAMNRRISRTVETE